MARIFVVGAGVVGTAVGRGFLEAGHSVTLVDVSPDRVDALVAAGLDATTRLDLRGEPSSFVFLTVPTPAGPQGYDLRAMALASRDVGRAIGQAHAERGAAGRHSSRRDARGEGDGYAVHTVVTRSTVPPGTTTQLVGPAVAHASGTVEGAGFVLAANPEFLRAASAEDDVRWPWMTVVGARSRRVGERLAALLAPFGGELRLFDRPETAELVKCTHDLYAATKVSFWNEMRLVASALGVEPDEVAATVVSSAEGPLDPAYGSRAAGPALAQCLAKDTDGFLAFARELGLPMPLLASVVEVRHAGALEAPGAGRVLDLREAERREAVTTDARRGGSAGYAERGGHHARTGYADQPGYAQNSGYAEQPGYAEHARYGGPHAWSQVPGARGPVSGDLPAVRPASRDPFTGDLELDEPRFDHRDGRPDDRW